MIRNLLRRVFDFKRFSEKIHRADRLGIDSRQVSKGALKLVHSLQHAGYQAFIVGGAVRDLLSGRIPKDFDVATNATPDEVVRLFKRAWIIGRRFRIVHVRQGVETIEVTTFRGARSGSCDANGQILRDNSFGTYAEDAYRRDFTVNALYYDPTSGLVHDFHHGVDDLKTKTLRIIGKPEVRFREDPVRMLRAIRFSGKLNFEIETKAKKLISVLGPLLNNVSEARRFDEILKLLTCGASVACLRRLYNEKLHRILFPLLDEVYSNSDAERFVEIGLNDTDKRIHEGKPINVAFAFAVLLWWPFKKQWEKQCKELPSYPALQQAANIIIQGQFRGAYVPRRLFADVREIWQLQPLFENIKGKRPQRLLQHPRFKLAFDFYLRRVEAGDAKKEIAEWWKAFVESGGKFMPETIESSAEDKPKHKRHRKRRSRAKKAGDTLKSAQTNESAAEDSHSVQPVS